MAKVTFIGAGSTVFSRNLLRDIFTFPELHDITVHLMDIDAERLRDSEIVANRVANEANANPTILATTDRREAIAGADYVINMIQVGGYEPSTVIDFEIPKQYGLRQTIGDTLGIGGIMRGLRTIPKLLEITRDMEELAPNALLLNYSNPMAMLCMAVNRASTVKNVGLCHSVFGTANELARILDVPTQEIDYLCAGINHMAFYLKFERNGEDLYPQLKAIAEADEMPGYERTRFELLKQFGYFVTESSEHFAEYNPWFIKEGREDLIEYYNVPLDEYPARCVDQIADWTEMRKALMSDDPGAMDAYHGANKGKIRGSLRRRLDLLSKTKPEQAAQIEERVLNERSQKSGVSHSGEYGTLIIHSMETGLPRVVYGNVGNNGIISSLPDHAAVEVPCLIDRQGVQPTQIGSLPPQLAALMQTNINVQHLTVEAALTGKKEHVYHAAMLDPHTAAELDLRQIRSLVDDLLEAHGDMMPSYV